jgi:mycothiol synthase
MIAESPNDVRIEVEGRLSGDEVAAVTRLVEAATAADGVRPLSEHVMLHLRHGGDSPVRNVLLYPPDGDRSGAPAAYAHLDVTDVVEGSSAELVVDPGQRGRGYGRALVKELLRQSPDGRLRLWAHGQHSAAGALARSMGFERMRSLWQLRRPLAEPLPELRLPDGIELRTFEPGADDDAWVALNARAFAGHPEQASWTVADLRTRMHEPWFDPRGFFLAERGGRLAGFHWTKIHGGDGGQRAGESHGHGQIGEVYVVGVDPDERRTGLGRALTIAGLRHLQEQGVPQAMLYVDEENSGAVRLYTQLGFQHWDTDAMFSRTPPA